MTSSENKALYRHFVDQVINNGKYDEIPGLYTDDYVDHNSPPGAPGGLEGVRAVFAMFRGAFPDVHFDIDEMVSEGDRVATRVTGHGTNTGGFMGMPPSGKEATWASKGIFRVANGRIAEHWGMPDLLSLLGQIGALPPEAVLPAVDTSGLKPRPDEPAADATDPARLARNKAIVRRVYDDGFSRGDMAACAEFVAADYVDHPPARFFDVPLTGPDRYRVPSGPSATAFPTSPTASTSSSPRATVSSPDRSGAGPMTARSSASRRPASSSRSPASTSSGWAATA